MYYRGAAAAIIVYDITKASSFNTLKNWVRELQQLGPENIVIAVCGNKADLEDKRVRARPCAQSAAAVAAAHPPPPPRAPGGEHRRGACVRGRDWRALH